MVAGFTRRLADLCGPRAGAGLFVDAGVEIARLARQTAKVPAAMTAGFAPGDARRCWELDAASWEDLPNSCFTYSAAGRALLGSRAVDRFGDARAVHAAARCSEDLRPEEAVASGPDGAAPSPVSLPARQRSRLRRPLRDRPRLGPHRGRGLRHIPVALSRHLQRAAGEDRRGDRAARRPSASPGHPGVDRGRSGLCPALRPDRRSPQAPRRWTDLAQRPATGSRLHSSGLLTHCEADGILSVPTGR